MEGVFNKQRGQNFTLSSLRNKLSGVCFKPVRQSDRSCAKKLLVNPLSDAESTQNSTGSFVACATPFHQVSLKLGQQYFRNPSDKQTN